MRDPGTNIDTYFRSLKVLLLPVNARTASRNIGDSRCLGILLQVWIAPAETAILLLASVPPKVREPRWRTEVNAVRTASYSLIAFFLWTRLMT